MNLLIKYAWHKDIVFHILTHMKVDNASNTFNPVYIKEILREKELLGIPDNLTSELENLTGYYMTHFERLAVINFIPLITNSFEELISLIINWRDFTDEDRKVFINYFVAILEKEKLFYQKYWYEKDDKLRNRKAPVEKSLNDKLTLFKCLLEYYNRCKHTNVEILLSYSMGQNGRGCFNQGTQVVAIPFPLTKSNETNTFFQCLHELTHSCTDSLISNQINISMQDGTHSLTENVVIIADYELIVSVYPALAEDYLSWICNISESVNAIFNVDMLYSTFILPEEVHNNLKKRVKEIVNALS